MSKRPRFAGIPRDFKGCVYVAELTNGVVKFGFSRNPRTRMGSLVNEVRRRYRCDVSRFQIGSDFVDSRQATRAEQELISRAARIGSPFRGRKEFFCHIKFPVAVNLVKQISRREYVQP